MRRILDCGKVDRARWGCFIRGGLSTRFATPVGRKLIIALPFLVAILFWAVSALAVAIIGLTVAVSLAYEAVRQRRDAQARTRA